MPDRITVLGIDIGSTTSHCILVEASIAADGIERTRNRVVDPKILYQSEVTFTPFQNETIDTAALSHLLDTWLPNRQVPFREVTNVGAIITGLAAVSRNRVAIIEELRRRFPKASVITAEDPRLESWVAWHGAAGPLSLGRPGQPILNFDIGGGTTNLALGVDGRVLATGSYFIGARHFLVDKGQLIPRSHSARAILSARPELAALPAADTAQALARLYTGLLENLLTDAQSPILSQFEQAAFPATDLSSCTITFSGGVGELIYANSDPPLFSFGDIGGHLARAIRSSPRLSRDLASSRPSFRTRATAIGLGLHNTWVSGASFHISDRSLLPLMGIPIAARFHFGAPWDSITQALNSVNTLPTFAVQILGRPANTDIIRETAHCLAKTFTHQKNTLVLLTESNSGKVLGDYVTEWGRLPIRCIALDEIEPLPAQFVSIGEELKTSVPVSFFGLY